MSFDENEIRNTTQDQEATTLSAPADNFSQSPKSSPIQNEPQKEIGDIDKNAYRFHFYSIKDLGFKRTPERDQELIQFARITNAPYQNMPLLIVKRAEDVLPLFSLFLQTPAGKLLSFFSVSSTDMGAAYMDSATSEDIKTNMDMTALVVEEAVKNGQIPVYSGVAEYKNLNILGQFVRQFLKKEIPGVIVANKEEIKALLPKIGKDAFYMGGLENPQEPYLPWGMSGVVPMEISPLTLQEKKIYFRYHLKELLKKYNLSILDKECDFLVQRVNESCNHESMFYQVFDRINQAIVLAFEKGEEVLSRETLLDVLPDKEPVYNPVKALAHMDETLKKKIFGQDKAIQTAHEIILANLDDESRIKPTVLGFFGPSGVGKTAMAEEISTAMNNEPITTFNMSEYSDDFKSSQLTGSSKGYVDSDEDGLLAQTIQKNPKAVILLDEFEKAHEKIQKIFLGIFDKGFVNDNHAGKVDMSQATFILTSNAGVRSNQQLGFGAPEKATYEADEDLISKSFPSELLGRIDAKILFQPLSHETLGKVVDKFMKMCQPRFHRLGLEVILSPQAREELITKGQNPQTGARPLMTLIRQKIKAPLEIAVYKKKIKVPPKSQRKHKTKVLVQSVEAQQMQVLPAPILKQQAYSL